MNTYEITFKAVVEAADKDDAEDFIRDLLDSDPVIVEYFLVEPIVG